MGSYLTLPRHQLRLHDPLLFLKFGFWSCWSYCWLWEPHPKVSHGIMFLFFSLTLGVGTYLKSKNPNVKVVLADPEVTSHKVIFHLVPLLAWKPVEEKFKSMVLSVLLYNFQSLSCITFDKNIPSCSETSMLTKKRKAEEASWLIP